jgi:hypothetical protein
MQLITLLQIHTFGNRCIFHTLRPLYVLDLLTCILWSNEMMKRSIWNIQYKYESIVWIGIYFLVVDSMHCVGMQRQPVAWWPAKPLTSHDLMLDLSQTKKRDTLSYCSRMCQPESCRLFENLEKWHIRQVDKLSELGQSYRAWGLATLELTVAAKVRFWLWNCVVLCEFCGSEFVKYCDRDLCQSHFGGVNSRQSWISK